MAGYQGNTSPRSDRGPTDPATLCLQGGLVISTYSDSEIYDWVAGRPKRERRSNCDESSGNTLPNGITSPPRRASEHVLPNLTRFAFKTAMI